MALQIKRVTLFPGERSPLSEQVAHLPLLSNLDLGTRGFEQSTMPEIVFFS